MEENRIEDIMQLDDEVVNQKMSGKIKKGINKTIYSKLIKGLLVVSIVIGGLYFGFEKFVEMDNYNPLSDENIPIIQDDESNKEVASFHLLMYVYTNLSMPGQMYSNSSISDYEDHGWAKYTLKAELHNAFDSFKMESNNSLVQVNKSKLSIDGFIRYVDMFVDCEKVDVANQYSYVIENRQKDIEEIRKLPDTSYFDIAISLTEKIDMKEFVQTMNTYTNSNFIFATTRAERDQYLGFSLFDHLGYGFEEEFNKQYPNLILLNETLDEKVLNNHYASMLKLMNDYENFKKLTNTLYDYPHSINYLEEYEKTKSGDVEILGYRVYASKADLLKMLESDDFDYYHIYDVKYSSFEN